MANKYNVLSDFANEGERSHQEVAEELLPKLEEKMPEEDYEVDFYLELRRAVLDGILRDLSNNAKNADWGGRGFENPEDFLDAEAVSEGLAEEAKWYFREDQTGKSMEILRVILEYADEYDIIED